MTILNMQNCILKIKPIWGVMYVFHRMWKFLDFMVKDLFSSASSSNVCYAQNVPNQRKVCIDIRQRKCDVLSRNGKLSLHVPLNVTYTNYVLLTGLKMTIRSF